MVRHPVRAGHLAACLVPTSAMLLADIDRLTLLLLILVGSLLLGILATVIFRSTVPRLLGRMFRTEEAEGRYLDLLKDGYIVRDRVRALQNEFNQLDLYHSRMDSDIRKLQRQIAATLNKVPDFIHEVGEPRPGNSRYYARLTVDGSSQYLKSASESYNPIWHHVNLAEIWASSRDEARQLLELAYSEKLGYQKTMVDSPAPNQERPNR
ncbi:MAG: hypothetical protein WCO00_03690 [Rhodospirillaceae bacterium]